MDPGYPGITQAILLTGARPVFCRCDQDWQIDLKKMDSLFSPLTKAVILSDPVNPTGQLIKREILKEIAERVVERDIALVLDLTYFDLTETRETLGYLQEYADHLILIGSFSKTWIMSGWRVGWLYAPGCIYPHLMICHQTMVSGVDQIAQAGACKALQCDYTENRDRILENTELVWRRCNGMGLDCIKPRGTFYCFPDIRSTGYSDEEFALHLVKQKKVAVLPGSCFGTGGRGHIRLSCTLEYEQLKQAMDRIESFVRNCCVRE